MTMPLMRPPRKNPVLRTPQMNLPPWARGRVALGLTAAAAEGRLELQVCQDCGAVQYPPRDACHACVSARLRWHVQSGAGRLLAATTLHHSNDLFFRERLPWRLGLVRLDSGPTLVVHLHGDVCVAGQPVLRQAVACWASRPDASLLCAPHAQHASLPAQLARPVLPCSNPWRQRLIPSGPSSPPSPGRRDPRLSRVPAHRTQTTRCWQEGWCLFRLRLGRPSTQRLFGRWP